MLGSHLGLACVGYRLGVEHFELNVFTIFNWNASFGLQNAKNILQEVLSISFYSTWHMQLKAIFRNSRAFLQVVPYILNKLQQ